jgi:hypothetical protein
MSHPISNHIRSNVVAYVALFFALSGGVAFATHPGGANTISSADIIDNAVRTEDLRDANVTTPDLRPGAVTSAKVADDTTPLALTGTDVANGSLTGGDLAADSLGAADLAPNSAGNSEIATGAVSTDEIFFSAVNGSKVENESLDGSDIQNLDGASIQGPEGWHQIGDPGEPAFQAGWQAGPLLLNEVGPGFYYDAVSRRVHLRGQLTGGNGTSTCAFELPFNRLPDSTMSYVAYLGTSNTGHTADFVLVRVGVTGVCVNRNSINTGAHISLDGISWRVS